MDSEQSEAFDMSMGGRMGGVETPTLLNALLRWALEPLMSSWLARRLGLVLTDEGGSFEWRGTGEVADVVFNH
eukprot:6733740-Lingulodinium_polyedra.AAC.1